MFNLHVVRHTFHAVNVRGAISASVWFIFIILVRLSIYLDVQVRRRPKISDTRNSTRKIVNSTLAIHVAVPAIPVKPSKAASTAMIKNASVQLNMMTPFQV